MTNNQVPPEPVNPTYTTGTAHPYQKHPRSASANPMHYGSPMHNDHLHATFPPRVAKRRKAKRSIGILLGVFGGTMAALCVIGMALAGLKGDPNTVPDPRLSGVTAMPTTSAPSAPVAVGEPAVAVPSAAAPSKPATATGGFSDEGTLLVPSEVKPGTYRATVPADSYNCYWARLKGTSHEIEYIIGNGNAAPGAKVTVTIKATDKAFHSSGCGAWAKV